MGKTDSAFRALSVRGERVHINDPGKARICWGLTNWGKRDSYFRFFAEHIVKLLFMYREALKVINESSFNEKALIKLSVKKRMTQKEKMFYAL